MNAELGLGAIPAACILALSLVYASPAPAQGKECPDVEPVLAGTVEGTMTAVGFIVGVRWGEGVLTLNDGKAHAFNASGAKLLDTGVADVQFTGNVYNLAKLEDFPGDYSAVSQSLTLVQGLTGSAVLTNKNCVLIELESESQGVRLSAPAPGGVLIDFAE